MPGFSIIPITALSGGAVPSIGSSAITVNFNRDTNNSYLMSRTGVTKYTAADNQPRTRTTYVCGNSDLKVHTGELASFGGGNFIPVAQLENGLMFGFDSTDYTKLYKTTDMATFTLAATLAGSYQRAYAVKNRLIVVCIVSNVYRIYASDNGGAFSEVTKSYGAAPDDLLIAPPAVWGWAYSSASDTLIMSTYTGGNPITATVTSSTRITLDLDDLRVVVGDTAFNVYTTAGVYAATFTVSAKASTVIDLTNTGGTMPSNGTAVYISTSRSHDQVWRIPTVTTAAVGGLTATFVKAHPNNYDGVNSHLHAVAYHAATGKYILNTGDGYSHQHTYISSNDGLTWTEQVASAAADWQDAYFYDDGHPTAIMSGSDMINGLGRLQINTPFRQGALLAEDMRHEMTSTFPGTQGDGVPLIQQIWKINNILCYLCFGKAGATGQEQTPEVWLWSNDDNGDAVRFALVGYGELYYAGAINGRMHFRAATSGTQYHVSTLVPTLNNVPSFLLSSASLNKAASAVAYCNSTTSWSADAQITLSTDSTRPFADSLNGGTPVSIKFLGAGMTRENQYGASYSFTGLTSGKRYIWEVWVYVVSAKRMAISTGSGNGEQFPARYYDVTPGWYRMVTWPIVTGATSQTIKVMGVPNESDASLEFNVGAIGCYRADAGLSTIGYAGGWNAATSGSENLRVTVATSPRVLSYVAGIKWPANYWSFYNTVTTGIATPIFLISVGKSTYDDWVCVYWDGANSKWYICTTDGTTLSNQTAMISATTDHGLPRTNRLTYFVMSVIGKRVIATLYNPAQGNSTLWDKCTGTLSLTNDLYGASTLFQWFVPGDYTTGGNGDGAFPVEVTGHAVLDFIPSEADMTKLVSTGRFDAWKPGGRLRNRTATA